MKRYPDNSPRGKLPPPVRVRVWFRISVRIRAEGGGGGGQFSSEAIVLEPFENFLIRNLIHFHITHSLQRHFQKDRDNLFYEKFQQPAYNLFPVYVFLPLERTSTMDGYLVQ